MEPAVFSVASMFDPSSSEDEEEAFVIRDHDFPGMVLHVREFAFHQVNANLLWPGAVLFADWIVEHDKLVTGRRILELGSGTGALAIFLTKKYGLNITTSDYDDVDIENNIRFNCEVNELACLPHIRHTWGETFPEGKPNWDLIIASDILLYVKQYANLIRTLAFLFGKFKPVGVEPSLLGYCEGSHAAEEETVYECTASHARTHTYESGAADMKETRKAGGAEMRTRPAEELAPRVTNFILPRPCFLMSWRRRIPKEDEARFFEGCKSAGFTVDDLGSRVYSIYPSLT